MTRYSARTVGPVPHRIKTHSHIACRNGQRTTVILGTHTACQDGPQQYHQAQGKSPTSTHLCLSISLSPLQIVRSHPNRSGGLSPLCRILKPLPVPLCQWAAGRFAPSEPPISASEKRHTGSAHRRLANYADCYMEVNPSRSANLIRSAMLSRLSFSMIRRRCVETVFMLI